ncbi:hypothetical protein BKP45_14260 [Anaerobacillus alkalidiazotrophicus]|uniref:Uncharacterized protein n=1 Tax=Anaerobacillus alkalidiazotrophicus TaxID=472963 RepID=A0A1S2M3K1_9BACI|nr:hypothetical protein [Anaerobacillus alkalidiazotrophicus]OIJ19166.1 hypothetical protein BKP45_14260 [Anaerobacillus alkalidiazotrophicus]
MRSYLKKWLMDEKKSIIFFAVFAFFIYKVTFPLNPILTILGWLFFLYVASLLGKWLGNSNT